MKTLEETLEEITPAPDPDFAADMERRMQMGFPPRRPPRFNRPRIVLPKFRYPAFAGAAASAMLALLVTLSVVNDDGGRGSGGTNPQPVETFAAEPEAGRSGDSAVAQRDIAPVPPVDGDVAPNRSDRRVERTAQLALATATDDFDQVADSVFRIAERRDGFVLSSSFTQGEEGTSGGHFELRVPTAQLEPALNELSRVATVRSRTESGNDVTGSFVAARDRLHIARAERKSLLGRLESARTARAADAIRQRLEMVAGQITGLRSQLRGLRERTSYAAISVELLDKELGGGAARTETGKAFDDAVGSLEDILNFLIRALGILVPVGLAAGLGWSVSSRLERRRRERALA